MRLARRVLAAEGGFFRHSCLLRSLVLLRSLRRLGYPVSICFGIGHEGEALAGHAWLELDSEPVAETDGVLAQYRVIYRFPEDATARTLTAPSAR